MEQTSCGAKLSRAGRSFVHLPLLTELRHVAKGVRLVLQPASLFIFPLTHGITENFRRRERVNAELTSIGASCTTVYWAHRDWALHSEEREADASELAATVAVIRAYLAAVRLLISCRIQAAEAASLECMRALSALTIRNERLGARAGYTLGGEGGMSRLAQYTRLLVQSTLALKDVRLYTGTPHVMRYFVSLMNYVSPFVLAPYWRSFCAAEDARAPPAPARDNCPGGYFSASMYCLIMSSLYIVVRGVEDVLDGYGLDDVRYDQDVRFAEVVALDGARGERIASDVGVEVRELQQPSTDALAVTDDWR